MRKIRVGPFRRSGRFVKPHMRKDMGKPGKTRGAAAWSRRVKIPRLHKISGYKIVYPKVRRQRALTHEVIQRGSGRKGALSTFRTLTFLRNVSPSRKADRIYKMDANYVGRRYGYKIKAR